MPLNLLTPHLEYANNPSLQAADSLKLLNCGPNIFVCFLASRLGIYSKGSEVMSGSEIESLDVHHLASKIHNVEVFYRANPKHKLKIVKVCELLLTLIIYIPINLASLFCTTWHAIEKSICFRVIIFFFFWKSKANFFCKSLEKQSVFQKWFVSLMLPNGFSKARLVFQQNRFVITVCSVDFLLVYGSLVYDQWLKDLVPAKELLYYVQKAPSCCVASAFLFIYWGYLFIVC